MQKKILIAMSGGVDSSVAAYLMQQAGFSCGGAIMDLWDTGASTAKADAKAVANRMGMDFHILDAAKPFRRQVVDYFVGSYEDGLTPNPCIACNRHLKFGWFLDRARELGYDGIATGHYARIRIHPDNGRFLLCKAADANKDQSYFLSCLNQQQLACAHFPLGELTKEEARKIAQEQGFLNAKKKDSQDICFVPDGDYVRFMKEYTGKDYPAGDFLDMDGKVVGRHQGAVAYTRGQRKGLGLAMGHPVYVCGKDMEKNTVTVGENEQLFSASLLADDWNFFPFDTLTAPLRCKAKARSRMVEQAATVYPEENGLCRVVFDEPQRALTTGQAVVLYDGDTVIGGGTITSIL